MTAATAATSPVHLVWRETDYLTSVQTSTLSLGRHSTTGTQSATQFRFSQQAAGGSSWSQCGDPAAPRVSWQIENIGTAGCLTLVQQPGDESSAQRLTLHFQDRIFNSIAFTSGTGGSWWIVGITAQGFLFTVDLKSQQGGLAAVQREHVHFVDLAPHWGSVGEPTCLHVVDGHVVIGGLLGPVLCVATSSVLAVSTGQQISIELANNQTSSSGKGFILKESTWGLKSLLTGWPRATPAVTALVHLPPAPGSYDTASTLLAIYDDGSLRGFNLQRQSQIFSDCFAFSQGGKQGRVHFAALCHTSSSGSEAALVVQTVSAEAPVSKSVHIVPVAPAAPGGRPYFKGSIRCAADSAATLIAAHGAESAVFLLFQQAGGSKVVRYTLSGQGDAAGAAVLLEDSWLTSNTERKHGYNPADVIRRDIWEQVLQHSDPVQPASTEAAIASAQRQVLSRMLAPGALYRDALRATLQQAGLSITASEVDSAGLEQLQTWAETAVEHVQAKNPGMSRPRCWALLLSTYQDKWSSMHPVLHITSVPGVQGQLLTVRGEGVQGILRGATVPEALRYTDTASASSLLSTSTTARLVDLARALVPVQQAVEQLSRLLGPWVTDACVMQLASGLRSPDQLVGQLRQFLKEGQTRPEAADSHSRQAEDDWRKEQTQQLREMRRALRSVENLQLALEAYAKLLLARAPTHAPVVRHGISSTPIPPTVSTFLSRAAQQAGTAQAQAALGLLLLLTWLTDADGLPGDLGLSAVDATGTLSLAQQTCVQAAVVAWLSSTPSAPVRLDPDVDMNAFTSFRISSPSAAGRPVANGTPSQPRPQLRTTSLTATLLPTYAATTASTSAALLSDTAVQDLLYALQRGSVAVRAADADDQPLSMADQSLCLAVDLFVAREHSALSGLAQLVGAASSDNSSLGLLDGLSQACSLPKHGRGTQAAAAARRFTQAAASLPASHSPHVTSIVRRLAHHVLGRALPDAAAQNVPLLQLNLLEVGMQVFEEHEAYSGALVCAEAALQQVRAMQQAQDAQPMDMDTEEPAVGPSARSGGAVSRAEEARLWTNVFHYHLWLQQWDAALAAAEHNPDGQHVVDGVRKLVIRLSEVQELDKLCKLALTNVLLMPPSASDPEGRLVSLRDEAVKALQRRASNLELSAQPQPYKVLYAFHASRQEWRQAAATMLAYAWRLRSEARSRTPTIVQEVLQAYELVVCSLAQLSPAEAWLDTNSPWLTQHAPPGGFERPPVFHLSRGDEFEEAPPHRCITVDRLRKEHAVLRAATQVYATTNSGGLDPLQPGGNIANLVQHLVEAHLYEDAVLLVREALPARGEQQQLALMLLVRHLATSAAYLQLRGGVGLDQPTQLAQLSSDPVQQQRLLSCRHLGSPAATLWSKLQSLLLEYLSPQQQQHVAAGEPGEVQAKRVLGDALRAEAADAVLAVDRELALPAWLLQLFTEPRAEDSATQTGMAVAGCGPAALLDLYLNHNRLSEAVQLVVEALGSWGRVDPRQRQRHAATWYPHNKIKALVTRLKQDAEGDNESVARALLAELSEALQQHTDLMASDEAALMRG